MQTISPTSNNPNNPSKILHTIREASHALSVSRSKLYELIQSGALNSVKIGQRRLIPAESLTAYVDSLMEAA